MYHDILKSRILFFNKILSNKHTAPPIFNLEKQSVRCGIVFCYWLQICLALGKRRFYQPWFILLSKVSKYKTMADEKKKRTKQLCLSKNKWKIVNHSTLSTTMPTKKSHGGLDILLTTCKSKITMKIKRHKATLSHIFTRT